MQAWTGVVLAGAALLVLSGIPKLTRPAPTITALRSVGAVWVGRRTVLLLTVTEILSGSIAIVVGGVWADATVAVLYTGFSIFLLRALSTPTASCGCTGRDDTPPTVSHLAMTVVFAGGAVAAAIAGGQTGLITLTEHAKPIELAVALVLTAITTWLATVILAGPAIPATVPATRSAAPRPRRRW